LASSTRLNRPRWARVYENRSLTASPILIVVVHGDSPDGLPTYQCRFAQTAAAERELMPELPGILNWALSGLAQYLKGGLRPPKPVVEATKEYRKERFGDRRRERFRAAV